MTQKHLVVNDLKLTYKGIFNFDEMFTTLKEVIEERGYKRHEKRFEEFVNEDGKNLFIEFRPIKVRTSYQALMVKIRIQLNNVREIVLDVDNVPTSFHQGEIEMTFDAWVTLHYKKRWNMNPIPYFIKAVINKYVYKFPIEAEADGMVASDCHYMYGRMKAHLNLYRYREQPPEEVQVPSPVEDEESEQ